MKKIFLLSLLILFSVCLRAQNYTLEEVRVKFDSLSKQNKGFTNKLKLNLSGLPLHELIASVAFENNLNVTVDPAINDLISYNFFDAQVQDMFVFLYQNFEIEYSFIGNIISVKRRQIKKEVVVQKPAKEIEVKYNPANDFLSLDLKNDTLWKVVEKITKLTDRNFIINPEIRDKQVFAYLQNRPFEQVLDLFSKNNNFSIVKDAFNNYTINPIYTQDSKQANSRSNSSKNSSQDLLVKSKTPGLLDVFSNNADISEVIKLSSEESKNYYVIYSMLEGKANLNLSGVSFEELLTRLFNGSKYHFHKKDGVYIIGENKMEGLRITELIRMENRTIENVKIAIPKDLTVDLEIIEFVDLNGLVVSGNERRVIELKNFLHAIDHVVPMVQIDVMLLTSTKGAVYKTGIKAGVKDVPTVTNGTVFPELDVELGSAAINNILNTITGFGFVNLGQVTENFYLSLQALENNNIINIESTPKISTLNGHVAKIAIGQTTYYQETQVNVQTTINNQGILQSRIWKSIDANLSVTLKPFVSSDEYVTIDVIVDQTDFSGRVDPTAPPNTLTQRFESLVRVKNGELILLGGLEKNKNSQSGSGVPFLSKIPGLKWLFSSRTKEKEKSKLHILIRPIVTY